MGAGTCFGTVWMLGVNMDTMRMMEMVMDADTDMETVVVVVRKVGIKS